MPELTSFSLDLILELAYKGWIGGLSPQNIGQIREACTLLSIRQEEFVVRAEEKKVKIDAESFQEVEHPKILDAENVSAEVCDEKFLKQG